MRSLIVYRSEFNYYLYPAVASTPSASESELETSLRVIKKLKAVSTAKPLSDEARAELEKLGGHGYSLYKLNDDQANLLLAEDERDLIQRRLQAAIPKLESAFAEEVLDLLRRVKDAPTVPDPVAAPAAPEKSKKR